MGRQFSLARGASLSGGPVRRSLRGRCDGAPDVRNAALLRLNPCQARRRPAVERSRRHLRVAVCDLGMFTLPAWRHRLCDWSLHHRCLLVHGIDFLRKPAVTLARSASDTFAGIRPLDVPPFMAAQLAGGFAAMLLFRRMSTATSGVEQRTAKLEHAAVASTRDDL